MSYFSMVSAGASIFAILKGPAKRARYCRHCVTAAARNHKKAPMGAAFNSMLFPGRPRLRDRRCESILSDRRVWAINPQALSALDDFEIGCPGAVAMESDR